MLHHHAYTRRECVLQRGIREYNVWILAKVMWSLQEVECGFSYLLAKEACGFEDEGREFNV